MRSIKVEKETGGDPTTFICAHWRTFPPPGAGGDIEMLRHSRTITTEQYQRLQVWERECGLLEMAQTKCLTCPHVRRVKMKHPVPVLVSPDGTETPLVDSATAESAPRHRHLTGILRRPGTRGSNENAAWAKNSGKDPTDG